MANGQDGIPDIHRRARNVHGPNMAGWLGPAREEELGDTRRRLNLLDLQQQQTPEYGLGGTSEGSGMTSPILEILQLLLGAGPQPQRDLGPVQRRGAAPQDYPPVRNPRPRMYEGVDAVDGSAIDPDASRRISLPPWAGDRGQRGLNSRGRPW